jgi:hypothetical protein
LVRLTLAGDRLAGELLTEQRAALAELLASFPRPTSATLLQALRVATGHAGTTPGL